MQNTLASSTLYHSQYVPYVGDSKRAMDEYTSEIFLGGKNTIVMHNTCEDSLLAAPIILDLVILAELLTRIGAIRDDCMYRHASEYVVVILCGVHSCIVVPTARQQPTSKTMH